MPRHYFCFSVGHPINGDQFSLYALDALVGTTSLTDKRGSTILEVLDSAQNVMNINDSFRISQAVDRIPVEFQLETMQ
jgi:hypothetical protein